MVEKSEVEVELVEVEFKKVMFWKVEEALTRRLFKVPRPPVKAVAKLLVEDEVVKVPLVAKKLVVVAEVPVALTKVKFWRVELPLRRRFVRLPVVPNKLVEKKLVEVAEVEVDRSKKAPPTTSKSELVVVADSPITIPILLPPFG